MLATLHHIRKGEDREHPTDLGRSREHLPDFEIEQEGLAVNPQGVSL